MSTIVPTITTDSQAVYDANLTEFSEFCKRIHADASDGSFAPTNLLPLTSMHGLEGVTLDVHLMSARPSEHLAAIIALKPSLCIVHAEVDDDVESFFEQLHSNGIKAGVAILRGTYPARVQNRIQLADHAMLFAGELGRQGGAADMLQTEKVPLIRAIKPEIEIGWDGGANLSTVRAIAHAGVDVINVGSAMTNATDKAAMYQSLIAECEKKGVLI